MTSRYNLKNIRTLLTEGFTDEELRQLCYDVPDFRPVYDQLRPDCNKVQIVNQLLEHTDRKLQIDTLLNLAKQQNPLRYEEHQPYYDKPDAIASDKAQRKPEGSNTVGLAKPRHSTSWWRRPEWVVPIIVTLITVIGSITVAFINIQQAETKVRQELLPTISVLETDVAKLTTTPFTQLITVTQIVQVTPTPDENVLSQPVNVYQRLDFEQGVDDWQLLVCADDPCQGANSQWYEAPSQPGQEQPGFTGKYSLKIQVERRPDRGGVYSAQYCLPAAVLTDMVSANIYIPETRENIAVWVFGHPSGAAIGDPWPGNTFNVSKQGWYHIFLDLKKSFDNNNKPFSERPLACIHIDFGVPKASSQQIEVVAFLIDDIEFFKAEALLATGSIATPTLSTIAPIPPTNTATPESPTNTPVLTDTPIPPTNTPVPPTNTPLPPSVLKVDNRFQIGQALRSPNGKFSAQMQMDGNFVLYDDGKPIWATDTAGSKAEYVYLQRDGNLVLYTNTGVSVWTSQTASGPADNYRRYR